MDTDGRAEHPNFGEKTGYIDQRAVLVCKKSLAEFVFEVFSPRWHKMNLLLTDGWI